MSSRPVVRDLQVSAPNRLGIVDITPRIEEVVADAGMPTGIVLIFCRHTTCGVLINEYEDGLGEDLVAHIRSLVPGGYFAHDDLERRTQNLQGPDEPANGPAHVRQILFGSATQVVPVADGRLRLGRWQRILFFEMDEPRPRDLVVTILGS